MIYILLLLVTVTTIAIAASVIRRRRKIREGIEGLRKQYGSDWGKTY